MILSLHLLACSQGGKVQGEKVNPGQDQPSHSATVKEEPQPQPEIVTSLSEEENEVTEAANPVKNSPPSVLSVALNPPDRIYRRVDITAIPNGVDPDGDQVSFQYQWVINGEASPTENSAVLRGDLYKRGDKVSVKVTPFDGEGPGEIYKPLPIIIPNAPPRFTSSPPMEFKSFTYTYQAAAEDVDGDTITFSLASAPAGMTIEPETGRIDWKISRGDTGDHTIEVVAEDGFGGKVFQKYTLSIAIP
ncbi:MAG: Ig domain-containing protein [Nitrospiria bacterium]